MSLNKKLFWGGLGWVLGGPIGGILGYTWASMSNAGSIKNHQLNNSKSTTQAGDFIVSLMVLFAKVMKADKQLLRSELNYVKDFLNKELKSSDVQYFMILFKDILKQDYPLRDVCKQIQRSMDHPSRIELIHILFGLSFADKHIDDSEIKVIHTIAGYLNINQKDYETESAILTITQPLLRLYFFDELNKAESIIDKSRTGLLLGFSYIPDDDFTELNIYFFIVVFHFNFY